MTDAIKKMLEPPVESYLDGSDGYIFRRLCVSLEDFTRLKRGFEKLMEQRNSAAADHGFLAEDIERMDAELEAHMRGES